MNERQGALTGTTKTSRRRVLEATLAGGAGLAALTLVGCGDDDSSSGSSPASSADATPEAGKPGGNLIVTAFADATTMDPHQSTSDDLSLRSTSLFEALAQQDEKLVYGPALAESWETSADGAEWTFKLRTGVVFHDGTPFNAAAAKANYDRVLDTKNALTARSALVFLKEAQVVDDYTIKLVHTQTDAAVLANAASLADAFTSRFQRAGEGCIRPPAGGNWPIQVQGVGLG